jgi:hypothetical protein
MPVVAVPASEATFFDFATLSLVEEAPQPVLPELPEKTTQEELRFMKIIAGYVDEWRTLRAAPRPYRYVADHERRKMATLFESMKTAENVAALFVARGRLKTLMDFAVHHAPEVLFICAQKGVR